jgi:hypothetical protein
MTSDAPARSNQTRIAAALVDRLFFVLRRVALILPALLAVAILELGVAEASRPATARETREIREDAKLYLKGRGWKVSAIRVSTVSSSYAKAAVQQGRGGPAGEMILHLRHGIWHDAFLGSSEFCRAPVPKRVLNDLGFRC